METPPQDVSSKTSVLIVSEDTELITSLINTGQEEYDYWTRDSIQFIFDTPDLLDNNGIVIFDVGTDDNDVETSVNQILTIKRQDPTQILMLVGESEFLGKVLKSRIQPLVYRAFTKPVSANQIFLGFKSAVAMHFDLVAKQATGVDITEVGPSENRTNVDSLVKERNSKSAIYAVVGIAALAFAGWWLTIGNSGNNDFAPTVETAVLEQNSEQLETQQPSTEQPDDPVSEKLISDDQSGSVQRINELNQLAATAMLEYREIAPKGDNALYYYDQVLALDAYDTTAYQGRKDIAQAQRKLYDEQVKEAAFDKALAIINVLQRIEPLNLENDVLRKELQLAIDAHVAKIQTTGTSEEIAVTTAVLEKIGDDFKGSESASNALQTEKRLVQQIDAALQENNLTPPNKNNAYSIVSQALKANTVSQANLLPRVASLSSKLLVLANKQFSGNNLVEAKKLAALVKKLKVDRTQATKLEKQIAQKQAKQKSLATKAKQEEEKEKIAVVEEVKIIPAKIISREAPRYPNRAVQRNIEGWVEVRFIINTDGVPIDIEILAAEPSNIFDKVAVKAVENWKFSPARIEETGLPVNSEAIRTKVNFKLN